MAARPSLQETLTEPCWCGSSPVLLHGKELLRRSVPGERDRRGLGALGPPPQEEFEVTEENQRLL